MPRILAVGGAHVDRRGRTFGAFVPGASNPGHMREDIGGGAFNVLRTATQRGVTAGLLSLRGGDAAGNHVAEAFRTAGVDDLSAVFLDRATPSYTAIVDAGGEVVAALADMELYEIGFPRQVTRRKVRDAIAAADAVVCDANLPTAALVRLAGLCAGKRFYAVAISPAKVVRFKPLLDDLSVLFMNRREALALTGLGDDADGRTIAEALRGAGLACAVVSDGGRSLVAVTKEEIVSLEPPRPPLISDATGAGDALAGAMVAAILRGEDILSALREGAAAAYLTLMSEDAVAGLAASAFDEALALVPEPRSLA